MRSAGYHEKMIGRTYFGADQVTQLNLVLYSTIKWPYQPKHSPSLDTGLSLLPGGGQTSSYLSRSQVRIKEEG